jgi:hypothetical protein
MHLARTPASRTLVPRYKGCIIVVASQTATHDLGRVPDVADRRQYSRRHIGNCIGTEAQIADLQELGNRREFISLPCLVQEGPPRAWLCYDLTWMVALQFLSHCIMLGGAHSFINGASLHLSRSNS